MVQTKTPFGFTDIPKNNKGEPLLPKHMFN